MQKPIYFYGEYGRMDGPYELDSCHDEEERGQLLTPVAPATTTKPFLGSLALALSMSSSGLELCHGTAEVVYGG